MAAGTSITDLLGMEISVFVRVYGAIARTLRKRRGGQ